MIDDVCSGKIKTPCSTTPMVQPPIPPKPFNTGGRHAKTPFVGSEAHRGDGLSCSEEQKKYSRRGSVKEQVVRLQRTAYIKE